MSLVEYAANPLLDDESKRTILHLINRVSYKLEDRFRDAAEAAAATLPDSEPELKIDADLLSHAEPYLLDLTWLNLQDARPALISVEPLRFLTNLTGLCIKNNAVREITALGSLTKLKQLHLDSNPITDLSPIIQLQNLQQLSIAEVEVSDLSLLAFLTQLTELTLSNDQVAALQRRDVLTTLKYLSLNGRGSPFSGFEKFPAMPRILQMVGVETSSLEGIDRFSTLQNLTNIAGTFSDLMPLVSLGKLTSINILSCNATSLECLASNTNLRSVTVHSDGIDDVSPLLRLGKLSSANITGQLLSPEQVSDLNRHVRSWDMEFKISRRHIQPCNQLIVVSDDEFSYYDSKQSFGIGEWDGNRAMLLNEMDWIGTQIETRLQSFLKDGDDFYLPFQVRYSRSASIVLYSDLATQRLRQVVEQVQSVLCDAANEWIIYLHTDMFESGSANPDLEVWVYRNCIKVKHEHADILERLIGR
jgi:hypothetical protein